MTDKELLELAAKAAGYSMSPYWDNGTKFEVTEGPHGWNPLTDDGDALQLAVKLSIAVEPYSPELSTVAYIDSQLHNVSIDSVSPREWYNGDPYAATRRAVVRAAAEIGKTL